jgi:hypothetical protein
MAIETIDNFGVFVGKNIDSRYGPYANTTEANGAINSIFRYKGLTVLLTGSGDIAEYWYYDGITDPDLVPKGAAISISGSNGQVIFFSGSTALSGSPNFTFNYTASTPIFNVTGAISASYGTDTVGFYGTASWALNATSASYAARGGDVTRIIAGTNITISPPEGTGSVTINSTGGGGLAVATTASFINSSIWDFTHSLNSRYVVIQALDTNHQQIIPETIELINTSSARLTFPTSESGYAVATIGGITASLALTASSYLETDPVYIAQKPTLATTGSNIFRGNQTVTGSLFTTGSNTLIGITTLTGSLLITGSTTQTGNNTLIGTTTLTGSILMGGDIIPTVSSSFDLGSVTNPFRSIYLQSGSISIRSDIPGGPDAIISNANGNVSIVAAGFQIKSGSVIPFQIDTTGRTQLRTPLIPAGDVGAFSIIGSSDGAYQPVTNAGGMVHITGNENASTRLNLDNFGNGGTFNAFTARAARGTASNPSQSLANDVILRIGAVSWKSDAGFTGSAVANTTLDVVTLENATSASHASAFRFYTAGVNKAYTRYLSTQIDATGITIPSSSRLFGTASWAENAQTASYVNTLTQTVTITGSLRISGSGFINGLPILTSANTSSFTDGFGWYGAFCSTGSQDNPVANISRSMRLETTEHTNGVSVVAGSRITFAHAGVYNIQFSAQLHSTSAGDKDVNIWFKKNGSNVARSNTVINVAKQNGDKVVAAWNYVDTVNANDYIEIMWQATDISMQLLAAAASGNIPSTPSVIVTATQVG